VAASRVRRSRSASIGSFFRVAEVNPICPIGGEVSLEYEFTLRASPMVCFDAKSSQHRA
jgi:hypothetical protein